MKRPVKPKRSTEWRQRRKDGFSPVQSFQSCASIPALFRYCFQTAAARLTAADLTKLHRTPAGAIGMLGWVSHATSSQLRLELDAWAGRDLAFRYAMRKENREYLLNSLGADLPTSPQKLVVLLEQLGDSFACFYDDFDLVGVQRLAASAHITPSPKAFLGDAVNLPPRLGQMTASGMVRIRGGAFWYAGPVRTLRALGSAPEPQRTALPNLVSNTLQRAVDDGKLRIALVTWRGHNANDLQQASNLPSGTFAVERLLRSPSPSVLSTIVQTLASENVHVALFPELMMDDAAFALLRNALSSQGARYPALTVVGHAHKLRQNQSAFTNTASAIDSSGHVLWEHEKLEPFDHATFGMEHILPRESESYRFADTPIGRIVINICRDVRADIPMMLNRMLGVTLILVPAYSKKLEFVGEEARVLGARQSSIVAAVNPLLRGAVTLDDAMYLYAPIRGARACSFEQDVSSVEAVVAGGAAFVHIHEVSLQSACGRLRAIADVPV